MFPQESSTSELPGKCGRVLSFTCFQGPTGHGVVVVVVVGKTTFMAVHCEIKV